MCTVVITRDILYYTSIDYVIRHYNLFIVLTRTEHMMQRNHSYQREIWSGSSFVHEIESTRMDHGQIELPKLGTGKPLEKTEM